MNNIIYFIFIFSTLRTLVPLIFNDSNFSKLAIVSSFGLIFLLALFSLYLAVFINNNKLGKFGKLNILNLFIGSIYILILNFFNIDADFISLINSFFFGIICYSFFYVDSKKMINIVLIISTILSLYIIWESSQLNNYQFHGFGSFQEAYDLGIQRHRIMRPDNDSWFGRSGDFMITGGLLGVRQHWSGVYLAMSSLLFAGLFIFVQYKIIYFLGYITSFVGLIICQSGTNIIGSFFGFFLIMLLLLRRNLIKKNISFFLLMILVGIILTIFILNIPLLTQKIEKVYNLITYRFSPETGDWEGMLNLGSKPIYFTDILFGFCSSNYDCDAIDTELAYLKVIFEYGLIYFIFYIILLGYPVFDFISNGFKNEATPYFLAYSVALFSLLHYGTVYATSNILFFIFTATMLIKYSNQEVLKNGK